MESQDPVTHGPAEDVVTKLGADFFGSLQQRAPACRRQEVPQADREAGLARHASGKIHDAQGVGAASSAGKGTTGGACKIRQHAQNYRRAHTAAGSSGWSSRRPSASPCGASLHGGLVPNSVTEH